MRRLAIFSLAFASALALTAAGAASLNKNTPAKKLFGMADVPSPGKPRPIGSYAKGCMAGATALPIDGPHWQVMRLSRNRNWGMPELVDYIEKLSADAAKDGWPGVLVGDMAQPRGGPMVSGHASHQIGLDADIWFDQMPDHVMDRDEREKKAARSLLVRGKLAVDNGKWTDSYTKLLKRAASYPEVARIFVSPAIKQKVCDAAGSDRAWLRVLRPWYGHDDHFHVRLKCPPGMAGCVNQAAPPAGDGCGDELAYWFKPRPPPKKPEKPTKPRPPPPEMTLADLPAACADVLRDGPGGVPVNAGIPVPMPRPEIN